MEKNARTIASLFGLEDQVDQLMEGFDSRIQALAAAAEGHTAIVGLVTSGSFNVLGNDGRCSIIGREVGYENIGVDAEIDTSTHGNEASFEFLVDKDPDYLFVLDRDAAIGTDGAKLAQEVVENELMKGTAATGTAGSSTWPIPPCGTPPRAASPRWTGCSGILRIPC